ncbi:hypothetical protein [Microbispora siamensis]|uniref:Uncharacterized protein n=1 Tax=Microbispora siamensis TaxID=564413 RepID=A0ABQ4GNT8_9ACTN|nr:hypothetical protein [Microbispora siamensis]GIH63097.1 hypothetical protein Msi02_39140 [Microbispora siamensis]
MGIAALVAWLLTAVGGFVMLGVWITRGGRHTSRFSPGLIFGHFALAAAGPGATGTAGPPERHFPVAVVAGHGLLAVATVVLVLLAALGVNGG